MGKHKILLLAAAGLILAVGQNEPAAAKSKPGICNRAAAEALSGKRRITNNRAKRMTGATIVRQIKPGQGVTMDYRRERITIETNPRTGKIVRAFCG
ncbi:MAG: hypothetical protein J0H34_23140 [Rhizobiales bacterium]|nr:hypothetical protein [Hyphomicrobiales bacterium]